MIPKGHGHVRAYCRNSFLKTGSDGLTPGRIVSIDSYPNQIPTFTWISDSGHVFCNLPPSAFAEPGLGLENFCDFHCPSLDFEIKELPIEGPGWGVVGEKTIRWKSYWMTVDWTDDNWLAHLVVDFDDRLVWIRNSKFQVGGEKLNLPDWDKQRESWKLW